MLSEQSIQALKDNKALITSDILEELRKDVIGKQIAFDILELPKDNEMYTLDAYGSRVSFNGNRGLKKAFTQLPLSDIHIQELERCANDVHYFKDNYVKIVTPSGVTFPTIREYQNDFLSTVSDAHENIVCLMPRQSGKSVSTAIYLSWIYVFEKNINIGICANKGPTAREFLDKTKQILINLPIWMQPGTKVWNKGSIENEQGVKILTDVPTSDAFRGYSIHCLVVDECIHGSETITINDTLTNKIKEIQISEFYQLFEDEDEYIFTNRYEVLTKNGFKAFDGIKKSTHQESLKFYFTDGTDIQCSLGHLFNTVDDVFVRADTLKVNDKIQEKVIQDIEHIKEKVVLYDLLNVQDGNHYITSGVTSHNCAFINTSKWAEFADAIFPAQSGLAWKKNILLSTANGMNHFYDIVKGAKQNMNGFELFEVDWKEPPRYKSDGTLYDNDEFKEDIIKKYGEIHFNQNYANSFIGSSFTLLDAECMEELKAQNPLYTLSDKLKVYTEPKKDHKYILTVDSSKNGGDFFGLGIYDITNYPFEEVAAAKLQVNYLQMPEFILEWAIMYNNAYVIIENNEGSGQSIADILYREYEYENLHFDKRTASKVRKSKDYPGFRTTQSNRPTLLKTLKTFVESGNLIIKDHDLIEELNHFILKNGKYQADDGYHDDLVMKTSFLFVPFIDVSNFDGYKEIIEALFTEDSNTDFDFMDLVVFGSFDQDVEVDSDFDFEDDSEFEMF